MKTINQYISEKLIVKSGKEIITSSVITQNEQLTKKNTEAIKSVATKFYIPNGEDANLDQTFSVSLPKKMYFVYKDLYRNKISLGSHSSLLMNMSFNYSDFEDFNPKSDILFSTNDEREACLFVLDYFDVDLTNYSNLEDLDKEALADEIDNAIGYDSCDYPSFLANLYAGEDHINAYVIRNSKELKDQMADYV